MNNKILVIAVHPDDETLGCGGTLLKHKENGDETHWVIVTTAKSLPGVADKHLNDRKEVIKKVTSLYRFDSVTELELPTVKLDSINKSEIIDIISRTILDIEPNIVYLPFAYDVHSDHRVVFECAYSCTKSFRYPSIKRILMMETLSETEFAPSLSSMSFIPNVFVDISRFIDQKLNIIDQYKSEIAKHPFPRSIETTKAQAMLRGSTCGSEFAESFMLLKEIL